LVGGVAAFPLDVQPRTSDAFGLSQLGASLVEVLGCGPVRFAGRANFEGVGKLLHDPGEKIKPEKQHHWLWCNLLVCGVKSFAGVMDAKQRRTRFA
jgi:hypothetical protein